MMLRCLCWILVVCATVVARADRSPDLAAIPATFALPWAPAIDARLLTAARDGQLDRESLLRAVLLAQGVASDEVREQFASECAGWREQVRAVTHGLTDDAMRLERVWQLLHGVVLRFPYDAKTSDLAALFERRAFNCLSAAIVFQQLADAAELDVRLIERPAHIGCRVRIRGAWQDVEPTCAEWLTASPSLRAAWLARVQASAADPHDVWRAEARELTDVGILAAAHYNRGLDLLDAGDFAQAAEANLKALALDPRHRPARLNFWAVWNNWAVARFERGEVEQAIAMWRQGTAWAPDYTAFAENLRRVDTQPARGQLVPQGT